MPTYGDFKDWLREGGFFRHTRADCAQRNLGRVLRHVEGGFVYEGIRYTPAYVSPTGDVARCRPEQIASTGHQFTARWNSEIKFLAFGKSDDMGVESVVNVLGESEERMRLRAEIAEITEEVRENRLRDAGTLNECEHAALKKERSLLLRRKDRLSDELRSTSPFVPDAPTPSL